MIQNQRLQFVITNSKEDNEDNAINLFSESITRKANELNEYLAVIDVLYKQQRKKKIKSYSTDYQELCQAIGLLSNDRKIKMDSMFKKCKSKYCKTVQEALYLLIGDRSKIEKLPQTFITNINIKYNKKYLYYSIENLYKEFGVIKDESALLVNNNERNGKILRLINMSFIDGYFIYLQSNQFSQELLKMIKKKGIEIALIFYYSAHLFIDYIMYSKGSKEKIKQSMILSCPQSQSYDTGSSDAIHYESRSSKQLFKVKNDNMK